MKLWLFSAYLSCFVILVAMESPGREIVKDGKPTNKMLSAWYGFEDEAETTDTPLVSSPSPRRACDCQRGFCIPPLINRCICPLRFTGKFCQYRACIRIPLLPWYIPQPFHRICLRRGRVCALVGLFPRCLPEDGGIDEIVPHPDQDQISRGT